MGSKNQLSKIAYLVLIIVAIGYVPLCEAEITGEFLLFPKVDLIYRSMLDDNSVLDKDDQELGADFFATFEINNFRFLGEYLATNKELEFERFQFGWLFKDQLFWLGRFHNPVGYWNSQYHHGAFLQTSISRPGIVEFEDNGGIIPIHQAGFLAEGTLDRGEGALGYLLSLATGPEFTDELESLDVLNPGSKARDISATLNLYLESELNPSSRVGLFVNYTEIPASTIGVSEIQQTITGVYGSWEFSGWRWLGASFYVRNQFERSTRSETDAFFNAYLQAEYDLNDRWAFYSRIEGTAGDDGDAYLALFPKFVKDRVLGGIRLDFASRNALKLEISAIHMHQNNFVQVMLQWSAMF
jgi:hypothetical protein